MKAQDIIKGAMRAIGVAAAGYDPTAEELQDGLTALNSMLQSWQGEGLTVPFRTWSGFTLTAGTAKYLWGSGQAFDATSPVQVLEGAYVTDSNATDTPVELMDAGEWSRMGAKDVSGRPSRMYVEYAEPVVVRFDFAPDEAYTFNVPSIQPFTTFSTLTTDDSVPDEYLDALKWNLAVRLAPEYGKDPSVTVAAMARSTKTAVIARAYAHRPPVSTVDKGLRPAARFNINTG